jgi:hypothetical protein
MKILLFAGALSLTLGACTNAPAFFADPTSVYAQTPTPLPDVSALQAVSTQHVQSGASGGESLFGDYRRRGVMEPLDWRRLNAEQTPEVTH